MNDSDIADEALNILGVVRNGGAALEQTLGCIDALRQRLAQSQVIIATNDNTDGTDAVLEAFAGSRPAVRILDLGPKMESLPDRVERITAARNATLTALFDGPAAFPLTLVLDLDGPNAELDPDTVLAAARRRDVTWDALFANQRVAYYDLYALRCAGWCEEDPWQRIHGAHKPLFFRKRWRRELLARLIYDRQYLIPPETPPIPVDSAFGGLGLYRTEALRGLRYVARDAAGGLICEHVGLHLAMRARGARLYIDPALLNITQTEHLGPSSGAPLPDRLRPSANL